MKKKVVFFVKQGLDNFLSDIIIRISDEYEVRKTIVTNYNQIDEGMQWADVCWFEWCDELIVYGSKLEVAKEKKVICRLHSYEAFNAYPANVNWENVDKLIFVSSHIRDFSIKRFNLNKSKTEVIPNGIDLSKYKFKNRNVGFNIAYVGYINYKKGPMLLLHAFKAIYDKNNKYKLYIAGSFQDYRDILYFQQMIKEFSIENNVIYDGWQNDLDKWLEDKNYILCTSILESQNMSIMQAMTKGIKPIVHNFVGAKTIYPKEYIWNTISEAVQMISEDKYNSKEYRNFIQYNYSLNKQVEEIKNIIKFDILDQVSLMKEKFKANCDDIVNSENLFNFLLDNNMEKKYMKYISQWFVRSRYDYTSKFNYYYGNMYRKFNSYSRFKYIDDSAYKKMELIGEEFFTKYYDLYFKNKDKNIKSKNMLFILNGLDIKQSVIQFFINYLNKIDKAEYSYSVLSLLSKDEFNNAYESIECFSKLNINLLVPKGKTIEDKFMEFYKFISENNINYCVYSSMYYAPIGVPLYPLLKKTCKSIGLMQFQQPEPYFDGKVDFVYAYMKKGNCCKNMFDVISPINTDKIDRSLNVRELLHVDNDKRVIVSVGRSMKYKSELFWKFVIKLVSEIDNVCFAVFGCEYSEFKKYVPETFLLNKSIFFLGFNLNASSYLKSCDFYLNSHNIPGGYAVEEAYYAGLPIITFGENEEDGRVFDSMLAGYYTISYLYKEADEIFPKVDDFEALFMLAKNLIENNSYRNYVQGSRKVDSRELTFSSFVKKFERYIDDHSKL
ncbi:glycosyltransferase family 4 protein [Clostridium guangxiense]|uniref:glycosyltransferase family 4 protein n=2 Tax=Clostridium TaxID=1485 RepID=UPI001E53DD85|nr:glycosyltransferase [Clostridium guangxiense]MCD2347380.1 glycosyltransferase [Clostridium guangxiense]